MSDRKGGMEMNIYGSWIHAAFYGVEVLLLPVTGKCTVIRQSGNDFQVEFLPVDVFFEVEERNSQCHSGVKGSFNTQQFLNLV